MGVMHRLLTAAMLPISLLGQDAILEHARQVNLDRAANLPNFVADEVVTHFVAKRTAGRIDAPKWDHDYTVEDEITVKGDQVSRSNVRRNGKAWDGVILGMPTTGFGAALRPLFDPQCPTTLELAGSEQLQGNTALAYRFHSPANGCFGNLYGGRDGIWAYNAARTGRVVINSSSGDVLQFEEEATGFPKGFLFTQRNQVMTWGFVRFGAASHWLPVSAEFIWKMGDGSLTRASVEYKNHRHFEAASDIRYK